MVKRTTAAVLIAGLGLPGIALSALPAGAQSPAPQITVTRSTDTSEPGGAPPAPSATAVAKAAPAGGEVLPWANKPLQPPAAPSEADVAATEAASQQCNGLFEAACRDLKTCAWVGDISRGDGTVTPARCVALPPAPPKKAAKKKTAPAKKAAAPVEKKAAAPAVKAAVTRLEDEEPAAAPVVEKKKPEPQAAPEVEEAAALEAPEKPEKKPEKQAVAPIVVKPPAKEEAPKQAATPMPSFGSISAFGTGNAVVVTVPPSSSE